MGRCFDETEVQLPEIHSLDEQCSVLLSASVIVSKGLRMKVQAKIFETSY